MEGYSPAMLAPRRELCQVNLPTLVPLLVVALAHLGTSRPLRLHLRHLDFVAQLPDTSPICILWLPVTQLGLIPHAYMPFAESQPDLRLVERFDAQPLPVAAFL